MKMRSAQEQLKNIKKTTQFRRADGLPASPSSWKKDGEDHINIASTSSTDLGRALSLRRTNRFLHPVLGSFAGINNIWFFLLAENPIDSIRMISDHAKLTEAVKRSGGERKFVENFRAMLIHSYWVMVLNSHNLMKLMANSDLPFDCYRRVTPQALPERFKFSSWLVEGLNEVRRAVKDRREPSLGGFVEKKYRDVDGLYIYRKVLEYITGNSAEDITSFDFTAWNKTTWAGFDKAALAEEEKAKRQSKAKKEFKIANIDAVEEPQSPVEADMLDAAEEVPVETGAATVAETVDTDLDMIDEIRELAQAQYSLTAAMNDVEPPEVEKTDAGVENDENKDVQLPQHETAEGEDASAIVEPVEEQQ